ncbi:histidine phosphatase family protein [Hyphobacterium sp. HN65]|uniref:Histidine phosphatase family protein n=1 Tax=Hyphobacterium lacteum TaxID=3116575 RepID=A0ABU7LS39_9PROT|nr:histidine phosphatase family protein [Hyphobacterium sp. HN65]MEE2526736.1 histidine phosphatase family protein [Hyphobacterium sp. HN65]
MEPVKKTSGRLDGLASLPVDLLRTAAFAVVTILAGVIMSVSARAVEGFDRMSLLELAGADEQAAIRAADRHILLVRHARKVYEECNALDCPLGEAGIAMVERLDALLGEPDFDAVYSSGACRSVDTVIIAGDVVQHAAAARAPGMCGGGEAERTREDAIAEAAASDARWTIVAEHSNTTCTWLAAIAGEATLAGTPCESGRLASSDYGDIFWLYHTGESWDLAVLRGVFDVAE